MQPDPADVAACLRVLAVAAERPHDPGLAAVTAAVDVAYRAGKKRRKAERLVTRREHDRALIATATRFREEIPPVTPGKTTVDGDRTLRGSRRCYVCKDRYTRLDAEYHMLCPPCAVENTTRRAARCDLTGRRAVVTGGRIKIGFHLALKLLRDGASVLVTTRFPADAARRFAAVPDAPHWLDRLSVHGVDLLDLAGVVGLVDAVRERWDGELDILVNNAAQTIRRPAGYHREVRAAEREPVRGLAAAVRRSGDRAALPAGAGTDLMRSVEAMFPLGLRDETGEPLDLRDTNSWVLRVGEVSPAEWLETHVVNAFVPFLLTGQLRPHLAASRHPDRYVVQVSAMEGSFSRRIKTARHPHTNMAKAGLNMLTRTVADEYAAEGIYMSSVDTGWVTDERPHPGKTAERENGFRPPLDVVDGAARVYDPIVRGVGGAPVHGVFLKDYREVRW
ncbi:SDR family NAD(P)-dependent oxidoreductase [Virgisporangium aurantiacum]|uniref:Oxidoreductase n=1 Tax=Virgisporangium aurantiacum TaxID=175570 RepID=A0A8J4DYK2_9ACTN|nr:SDR family oxidoreductase [Virgisporangium aurantiacum]GIJ55014.1 oxidoreductase [Virgisporangium aurantiacum]